MCGFYRFYLRVHYLKEKISNLKVRRTLAPSFHVSSVSFVRFYYFGPPLVASRVGGFFRKGGGRGGFAYLGPPPLMCYREIIFMILWVVAELWGVRDLSFAFDNTIFFVSFFL